MKVTNMGSREKYGFMISVVSIFFNFLLFLFKFSVGSFVKSISIMSDGFNNLSDAFSNFSSLFGFYLTGKHADKDHPYGHGRSEYIAGMIISFFILFVGISSFKESVENILHPTPLEFSYLALFVLVFSIIIKMMMAIINKKVGKKIDSSTLIAASKDSLNDVVTTSATIISLLFTFISDFSIDGYIGIFVSLFIIKSGIEVFKDTSSPLLGQTPDPKYVKEVLDFVNGYDEVLGVHDLMIHEYGVTNRFITLHAEVRSDRNLIDIHNVIDEIERKVQVQFNALTTIHYDPICIDDDYTNDLKEKVEKIVVSVSSQYSIHDFRVVKGKKYTKIIFDLVLPIDDHSDEEKIRKLVEERIDQLESEDVCKAIISVEHDFAFLE